jgi:hypothetical protein
MDLIVCAGDTFTDKWIFVSPEKKRFKYEFQICVSGGGARVFETLEKDILDFKTFNKTLRVIDYEFSYSNMERYITNNKLLFEVERKDLLFKDITFQEVFDKQFLDSYNYKTLVISDYDRSDIIVSGKYDLLLVDSKYRTFNFNKEDFKLKIWRCTQSEYNKDYAANFDWIIITNHEDKQIVIVDAVSNPYVSFQTKNVQEHMREEPFTELESIGAGDFFIAHLAFYLTDLNVIRTNSLEISEAVEFAVLKTQKSLAQQTYDIFLS